MKAAWCAIPLFIVALLLALAAACAPEGPPPLPQVYSGTVTVAGSAAPDGLRVAAAVDGYESAPVEVQAGRYAGLTVAPPGARFQGKGVRFSLLTAQGRVAAREGATFQTGRTPEVRSLDLSFPPLSESQAASGGGGGGPPMGLVAAAAVAVVVLAGLGALQRLSRRGRRDRWRRA